MRLPGNQSPWWRSMQAVQSIGTSFSFQLITGGGKSFKWDGGFLTPENKCIYLAGSKLILEKSINNNQQQLLYSEATSQYSCNNLTFAKLINIHTHTHTQMQITTNLYVFSETILTSLLLFKPHYSHYFSSASEIVFWAPPNYESGLVASCRHSASMIEGWGKSGSTFSDTA